MSAHDPPVRTRRARMSDWEVVRDLRLRALADAPDAFGSTLEVERAFDRRRWVEAIEGWSGATNALVVAEAGEVAIGMAIGSRDGEEADAHLYGMWVDPAWRGGGVGRRLVAEVLDWARSWGARAVVLAVTETNHAAARFYEQLGFGDTGERHPLREGSQLSVRVKRREL